MKKFLLLILLSACSSAPSTESEPSPAPPAPETVSAPLDAGSPPPTTPDASLPPLDAGDAAPPAADPCERTPLTQELCFHSGMTPAWSAKRACDGVPFFRGDGDGGRVERPYPEGCDPTIQSCGLEGCEARSYGSVELWCCP